MFRKIHGVNPLQLRKELLVAESDLNRAQLVEEWQTVTDGAGAWGARLKSIGSLASGAALLVASVSAFRRGRSSAGSAKSSWLKTALTGIKVASGLWLAFRSRAR